MPNEEVKKLPEIKESPSQVNAGGGGGGGGGKFGEQQKSTVDADTSSTSVVKQPNIQPSQQLLPQKTPVITPPIQKADTLKTQPQQPITPPQTSKPVVTQPPITNEPPLEPNNSTTKLVEPSQSPPQQPTIPTVPSKPVANSIPPVPESSPSPTSINPQSNGTQPLTPNQTPNSPNNNVSSNGSGNASRNGIGNGSGIGIGVGDGSGNGIGNGSGNGIGNGSGNGTGNGSGNGVGNQPEKEGTTVVTAPKPPTDKDIVLDPVDCIKCDIKYPERAIRLRIQGNAKVALDADENGNVTSVRLIRSTGDRELDEAAQTTVLGWKLKPKAGGRQGVKAAVNYKLKR